jgi:hypothetical protein
MSNITKEIIYRRLLLGILGGPRRRETGIIILAGILLAGLTFIPTLDVKVDAQSAQLDQLKNQILKTSCSDLISPIAKAVTKAYPGVSAASVQHLLQQIVKEVTKNSGEEKACKELRQIAYQVLANGDGIVASSLAIYVKQIANKKDSYDRVVKEVVYRGGSSSSSSSSGSDRGGSDCSGMCQKLVNNIKVECGNNCDIIINNLAGQIAKKTNNKYSLEFYRFKAAEYLAGKAAGSPTGDLPKIIQASDIPIEDTNKLISDIEAGNSPVAPGIEPGTEPLTELGTEPLTELGTEPLTEPGDLLTELGTEPLTEPGDLLTELGTEQGTEPRIELLAGEGLGGDEALGGDGESGDGESGDGESGDGESGDGESGDGESGDGESGDGESGDGESSE